MIINYDKRPDGSIESKLQSLIESIHLALNELEMNLTKAVQKVADSVTKVSETVKVIQQVVHDGDAEASNGRLLSKSPQNITKTVNAGSSVTYTFENNNRGVLILLGTGDSVKGMYIVNKTSTSALGYRAVLAASGATLSVSDNVLTVANTTTSTTMLSWFIAAGANWLPS